MIMPTTVPYWSAGHRPHDMLVACLLITSLLAGGGGSRAAEPTDPPAEQQQQQQQRRAFRAEVQFAWEQTPLREGLGRLGAGAGIAVVVDRRVDPETTVTLDMPPTPLLDCLDALAEMQACGVSVLPHAVYFGPADTTREMATILAVQQDRIRQLSPELQRRWSGSETASWPKLAEPRRLVEDRAARRDIKVLEGQRIPHDLWAETTLPDMPLLEQFVILLAGFRLAPEVDLPSGHLRVMPMPEGSRITRTYPRSSARSLLPDVPGRDSPRVTIEESRRQWTVTAPVEFHRELTEAIAGKPAAGGRRKPSNRSASPRVRDALPAQRFTLTVQNQPLGAILKTISRQTGLHLEWNADEERWSDTRRSVSVKNATLAELLEELFRDLPIDGQAAGPVIRVDLRP